MIEQRVEALRSLLRERGLDAVVVTKEVNLFYFSGFRGDDTTLIITPQRLILITDNRYTEQAKQQAPLYELVEQKHGLLLRTAEVLDAVDAKKIGFEGNHLTYLQHQELAKRLPGREITVSLNLDDLRQVKDAGEIA
ncbi:MAG: aminopeptidase P family N-terminal domain-containing protein, partial [Selenomonas sp.]|nr:aminopeptidase P family N-terminal domain-containing protein [Selenomonas sp.]